MRKITPEDLFEFRLVGALNIHPTRHLVAYQEEQANRETNHNDSRIMTVEPGQEPRVFTRGPSDRQPRFSPNGLHLAFLSERSGTKQVWVMPTDGGEPRQVTKLKGAVEEYQWMPDSKGLVYIALISGNGIEYEDDPEPDNPYRKFNRDVKVITETFHKFDGVGYFNEYRPHVVMQSLEEDDAPRQLTAGPMRHSGLAVSENGRWVLTLSRYGDDYDRNAGRNHVYLIDTEGSAPPKALTHDPLSVEAAVFGDEKESVYFLAQDWTELGYDNTALYRTDLNGSEAQPVAEDWDRPWSNLAVSDMPAPSGNPLCWDSDGQHLYSLTSRNGATHLARINIDTHSVELITHRDQVYYSLALTADGRYAALAATHPTNPGYIEWISLREKDARIIANPNKAILDTLSLAQPERFTAQAPGGPPLDAWVMRPVDLEPGQKVPLALEIHGGPMMMYAQSFFLEFQWLAANGYGVVYGNPRGSQGYGKAFCTAIQKEWGNRDYADIMACLDTAIATYDWVDCSHLGVLGGSYGGYMTNWILGHSTRFKAAVTMRSVADWRAMVGTGDLGWHWIQRTQGQWPWSGEDEWYRQQSPITYVGNITTPLLIEHQEGDLRCPIEQGQILFTALKYFNQAPVKFIRYPEEFHGMSRNGKPWHRVYRLNSITDWFAEYL